MTQSVEEREDSELIFTPIRTTPELAQSAALTIQSLLGYVEQGHSTPINGSNGTRQHMLLDPMGVQLAHSSTEVDKSGVVVYGFLYLDRTSAGPIIVSFGRDYQLTTVVGNIPSGAKPGAVLGILRSPLDALQQAAKRSSRARRGATAR